MCYYQRFVIHPIKLVAREDQKLIHIPSFEELSVLAHGIGSTLEPAWAIGCLLGRKNLNKATPESRREIIGEAEMAIK